MCTSANRESGGKPAREKACERLPKGTYFPHPEGKSMEGVKQGSAAGMSPGRMTAVTP